MGAVLGLLLRGTSAEVARPSPLNAAPGVRCLGSQACAQCHKDIVDSFSRTDMGRSLSLPNADPELERINSPVTVYDRQIERYFQISRTGADVYQSEYALDSSGRKQFEQTQKIAYSVGAGENGYSYLIDRGGYLFQAPLSYYSAIGKWDLSPAHELGFTRAITVGCIACHAGQPQPVAGRDGLYQRPPFKELAIGCEKCHGPGELHVKARLAGEAVPVEGDPTIVNPARLPGWLANNVCMYCHEKGDAEVLQPGKSYLDFRPGTPLDTTLAVFKMPLKPGTTDQSPLLNHYFLMTMSKCFRASGRMTCMTCHDPHYQPSASAAEDYYDKKCLNCHTTGSCSLSFSVRLQMGGPGKCVGCHMPAKRLGTIAHSALTDHRIPARAEEPLPSDVFQASDPAIPGLIHLSANPGQTADITSPTLLRAYADLADEGAIYKTEFERRLAEAAKSSSSDPVVLGMLARHRLKTAQITGQRDPAAEREAIDDLERAIRLGATEPEDYQLLGQLLARAGRFPEAIEILHRAMALAPYTPALYPLLSDCYTAQGNNSAAVEALQNGLRLFPEDSSMREMLRAKSNGKRIFEAPR